MSNSSATDFSTLPLSANVLTNLNDLGYERMTPIQAQSLPLVLAGKDIIAQAKTGSGKTAAFGLGLLHTLDTSKYHTQSLVLCPTRELADQVSIEIRKLARTTPNVKVLTLCGGMPFGPQIGSLEFGAHIVVGTPGRIDEHIRKGSLKLDQLRIFVLDEADRMLDMGFQETIDNIIEVIPEGRQTLLFSATFPKEISAIAQRVMQAPVRVTVESEIEHTQITQHFFSIKHNDDRLYALRVLLLHYQPESTVVFCNTKIETQEVANALNNYGFSALAIHGDLEQRARDEILIRFSNNSASILVATDVAARGLDIDSLDAVINYQITRECEVHVHRVGRTGRGEKQGLALTIVTEKETYKLAQLSDYLKQAINLEPLPSDNALNRPPQQPRMATLQLDGGKKDKIRPGDILGALTNNDEIDGKNVGKIKITHNKAYVAVEREIANIALKTLSEGKLKGRAVRARRLRG